MPWRSDSLPPVPETTAALVKAAFPNGHLYVDLHTEFGCLYDAAACAARQAPHRGRPVAGPPWRLALVTVMPSMEGLPDRQAADAVRRCMDWQDALRLDRSDPGVNFTWLPDVRERFVYHEGSHQLLDTLLEGCKARRWINVRGQQRTDATHVLAAIRTLNRLERALETLRAALNQLSEADPQWVRGWAPREWYERDGPRAESCRLPKERRQRESLALLMGVDGYALMEAVYGADEARHLRHLPDFEALRRSGMPPSDRCREPGLEEVRWRQNDAEPPSALRLQSPDALEARYGTKRATAWGGLRRT